MTLQPPEEVAEALKSFVLRMEEHKKAKRYAANTPWKPQGPALLPKHVQQDNIFESSAIKYIVTQSTPFYKK